MYFDSAKALFDRVAKPIEKALAEANMTHSDLTRVCARMFIFMRMCMCVYIYIYIYISVCVFAVTMSI
jgi:hypothetical protein